MFYDIAQLTEPGVNSYSNYFAEGSWIMWDEAVKSLTANDKFDLLGRGKKTRVVFFCGQYFEVRQEQMGMCKHTQAHTQKSQSLTLIIYIKMERWGY